MHELSTLTSSPIAAARAMPSVLMFSYYYPPMLYIGAARAFAFSKYLSEFGYRPVVVAQQSTDYLQVDHAQLIPEDVIVERIVPGHREEFTGCVTEWFRWAAPLERLFGRHEGWLGEAIAWRLAKRFPHFRVKTIWTNPCLREAPHLIEKHQPDLLWATGTPFESLKVAAMTARRYRLPFVADFRDPWLYTRKRIVRSKSNVRATDPWERYVVSQADRVVVVTSMMQQEMQERFPDHAEKIVVITNGFDSPIATNSTSVSSASGKNGCQKLIISHVGTLDNTNNTRPPGPVLDAVETLRSRFPQIATDTTVRLVGNVDSTWHEGIERRGLRDMFDLVGPVDLESSRSYMRRSDLLLVYEPGAHALTGKLFDYLAARRPILAMTPVGGEVDRLIAGIGAGVCVGVRSPDSFVEAVHDYYERQSSGKPFSAVPDKVLMRFHRRTLTESLARLFDEVLADPKSPRMDLNVNAPPWR